MNWQSLVLLGQEKSRQPGGFFAERLDRRKGPWLAMTYCFVCGVAGSCRLARMDSEAEDVLQHFSTEKWRYHKILPTAGE
jgi:hypothetical protein